MIISVGIITTITSFFYSNITDMGKSADNSSEFEKFNMYFLEDIKQQGNAISTIAEDGSYIAFTNGNTYTFQDKCIYKNKAKICKNIQLAKFSLEYALEKKIVIVNLSIGENTLFNKTMEYVMAK